jgi:hypothetical protein
VNRRVSVSGGVELVAALEHSRTELVETERVASAAVAAARGRVAAAQSRVDELRVGFVREHAQILREHSQTLRERAAAAGDETEVVSVVRFVGPGNAVEEPQLRFRRVILAEQAAAADGRADWLDGYLQRGDALRGESLATLVGQLEPLPEALAVAV